MGGPGPLSGPLRAVLDRLGSALRCYVGGLGSLLGPMFAVLGFMLAVLGRCWGRCWRSWRLLGLLLAVLSRLGLKKVEEHDYLENVLISRAGARSAAWWAVLSRSWGLCWRSWAALGAYVGGLGPLLGPMLAVLGRSWSLCWRSWGVLGPKWSVLGRSGRSREGIRAEKWAKPQDLSQDPKGSEGLEGSEGRSPPKPPETCRSSFTVYQYISCDIYIYIYTHPTR